MKNYLQKDTEIYKNESNIFSTKKKTSKTVAYLY